VRPRITSIEKVAEYGTSRGREAERGSRCGRAILGISGYDYKGWRGRFYPAALPARRWLEYASRRFDSIELNGTFYSLKSPAVFERWVAEVPDDDFVFAMNGGRFITRNLKLRNVEASLGNFFASGVLLLGEKTGPFLWQLPGNVPVRSGSIGHIHATATARFQGRRGGRSAA
jgi:uncharacterized protein YecE (DUF72 family)